MEPYRIFFESSFDRLEEHLQTMVAEREDRLHHRSDTFCRTIAGEVDSQTSASQS